MRWHFMIASEGVKWKEINFNKSSDHFLFTLLAKDEFLNVRMSFSVLNFECGSYATRIYLILSRIFFLWHEARSENHCWIINIMLRRRVTWWFKIRFCNLISHTLSNKLKQFIKKFIRNSFKVPILLQCEINLSNEINIFCLSRWKNLSSFSIEIKKIFIRFWSVNEINKKERSYLKWQKGKW